MNCFENIVSEDDKSSSLILPVASSAHNNIIKKKPTEKGEKLINKRITYLTLFIDLKKTAIILALFMIIYHYTKDIVLAQTMSFTWLVFSHFVRIVAIRYDEKMNLFVNRYLNWSLLIPILLQIAILQIAILYTSLSKYFHSVSLHWMYWIMLATTFIITLGLAVMITAIIDRNIIREDSDY